MKINYKKNTIEMTKKFANAARKYGSAEYKALVAARRDYPSYRVVISKGHSKSDSFKGLTYDRMAEYIKRHDDENRTKYNMFLEMRGMNEDSIRASRKYGEIKKWFLDEFPEVATPVAC